VSEADKPIPPFDDEEDEATLAAIDEGIRDAQAGRVYSPEETRKSLNKWITDASTRKER
jgi:predicted transcriptional regulator